MVVYTYLMGGLGNQMFQIATGLSHGIDNNDGEVFFSEKTNLGIIATHRKDYNDTIFEYLPRLKEPTHMRIYSERGFEYQKLPYEKEMRMRGYFQSEKYFKNNKDSVVKFFKTCLLRQDIKNLVNENLEKFSNSSPKTISVHIRRGDYVNLQHVHPVQSEKYYESALIAISNKLVISYEKLIEDYKLVIFSDDIAWCKNSNLFSKFNCHFVEGNEDYIDMYVMSMCKHHIIANSSFSWWGAYLNESDDKIVVAPKLWFGPQGPKTWNSVYCTEWIVV